MHDVKINGIYNISGLEHVYYIDIIKLIKKIQKLQVRKLTNYDTTIWKPIIGYEDRYVINKDGDIDIRPEISGIYTDKILKQYKTKFKRNNVYIYDIH